MRMKSFGVFMVLGMLGVALTSAPAFAKKSADSAEVMEIQTVGVKAIDDYFAKAGGLVKTVSDSRLAIDTANKNLVTVLGLKEGTPVADALADLKTKAAGKIKVGMNGAVPKLEAADDCPENVKTGIEAANGLLGALGQAAVAMPTIVTQAPALVTEGQALAPQVPGMVASLGLKAPGASKAFGKNLAIIVSLPVESKKLIDSSIDTFKIVKDTFGG